MIRQWRSCSLVTSNAPLLDPFNLHGSCRCPSHGYVERGVRSDKHRFHPDDAEPQSALHATSYVL
jgi:hypothetical protein